MMNFDNLQETPSCFGWHCAGNRSVGGRIRSRSRYRDLTDAEARALKFTLKHGAGDHRVVRMPGLCLNVLVLNDAVTVLVLASVQASPAFFRDRLGFGIDFLPGDPPFYRSVS
jgi:hypothetical protein